MSEQTPAVIEVAQYKTTIKDIERAEKLNPTLTFQYETPRGNKEARSHINDLRKIKGSIERERKEAKAYFLEAGRQVDSQAKEMTARVEALIEVHDAPLKAIEAKEQARKDKHQGFVDSIKSVAVGEFEIRRIAEGSVTVAQLQERKDALERIAITDQLEEFQKDAQAAYDASLKSLEDAIQMAQAEADRREESRKQAAEIKRLQDEAAENKRLADIEAAKREAEVKAKAEAEAQLKQAAEDKARMEREAIQREADAKMAAERAELRRLQEAEAAKEREALAVAKAKADAEAEAKRKEDERLAQEAEVKRQADARAANQAHRDAIVKEIATSICEVTRASSMENATIIARAIVAGDIARVKAQI